MAFKAKKNEYICAPMLSRRIKDKLRALETPFYLYDIDLLRRTAESAAEGARSRGYVLHYAIKANYDPRVLGIIRSCGFGIDCASANELRCALEAGFDPGKTVYAGVGKKDSELRYAISQNIFSINCESVEELYVLDSLAAEAGRKVNVALRVNPDVDPKTNSCINTGQMDCKFGISYEEILSKSSEILSLKNLNIRGVHIHIGSQIREMDVFESLCERANVIVSSLLEKGFNFEFVDLGGGLGIDYDSPEEEPVPDFEAVYSTVDKHLSVGGREVHFEFGRAIVGQCAELITRVLYNKTTASGLKYAIVDASMTELIRPALYGAHHSIENLTSGAQTREKYTIGGTACESTDIFASGLELPSTVRGDLLSIKSAGAYGQSMASRYNSHDLPRSEYSDEL